MTERYCAALLAPIGTFLMFATGCTQPSKQMTLAVAVPARAGAVVGRTENSDAFIWQIFTQFTAPATTASPTPVTFETWASDKDTFSTKPHWPDANEPLDLHPSVLAALNTLGSAAPAPGTNSALLSMLAKPID
jgi:hypothetical protein